jgi:hypothetical protein
MAVICRTFSRPSTGNCLDAGAQTDSIAAKPSSCKAFDSPPPPPLSVLAVAGAMTRPKGTPSVVDNSIARILAARWFDRCTISCNEFCRDAGRRVVMLYMPLQLQLKWSLYRQREVCLCCTHKLLISKIPKDIDPGWLNSGRGHSTSQHGANRRYSSS